MMHGPLCCPVCGERIIIQSPDLVECLREIAKLKEENNILEKALSSKNKSLQENTRLFEGVFLYKDGFSEELKK